MARIRQIKPEMRRSRTVGEWPREVRYAWVLLWGYLDDEGRGDDDLRLLVSDLFPLDRDVTERKIDGWLWTMATDNPGRPAPLCRYTVDGLDFLHATNWTRHQRVQHPQVSKIPPCPIHEGGDSGEPRKPPTKKSRSSRESIPNDSGTIHESIGNDIHSVPPLARGAGSRGQGVKGSGVEGSRDQGVVGSSSRSPLALGNAHENPGESDDQPPLHSACGRCTAGFRDDLTRCPDCLALTAGVSA